MSSYLMNFALSMDMRSSPMGLRIKGKTKLKTFWGFISTIISLTLSVYLSSETFWKFFNRTNPIISEGSFHRSENIINFDSLNFYFSLGMLYPKSLDNPNKKYTFKNINNFEYLKYFSDFHFICSECGNTTKHKLNLCRSDEFKGMKLDFLPKSKSDFVVDNLKIMSFCLPDDFGGNIKDIDQSDYLKLVTKFNVSKDLIMKLDSSLTLFLPRSNLTLEENNVRNNTKDRRELMKNITFDK